ncbi:unnamed protein product, partial [Prorocentrum cordatum]
RRASSTRGLRRTSASRTLVMASWRALPGCGSASPSAGCCRSATWTGRSQRTGRCRPAGRRWRSSST